MSGMGQINAVRDPALRALLIDLYQRVAAQQTLISALQAQALQRGGHPSTAAAHARVLDVFDPEALTDAVNVRFLREYVQAHLSSSLGTLTAALDDATSQPGQGSVTPLVDLPNLQGDVAAYAAANPFDFANSCLSMGGSWAFMDGLVPYLQAIDERVGFNGKRGDVSDPSQDALAYYHGPLPPISGSNNVYVVDVIAGHCGPTPTPAWNNVTRSDTAGAWMPTR